MRSRSVKNKFREHRECNWEFDGRGLKANAEGDPIEVLVFVDIDCGITEFMPIHNRTHAIALGNGLIRDMKWDFERFKFGSIEFLRTSEQLAPEKATFFYPTMFHTYDATFGQCEFDVNGNSLDGREN